MKNFYKKSQSGRSMVEMLGVLAIIGVLSVGGIAGYSKAMQKHKINKALEQISLIIAQVNTTFSGKGNYDGLTAYSAEIIKAAIGNEAAAADNSLYRGGFTLQGSGRSFSLELAGLGQEACIAITTANWGDSASGISEINVRGGNYGYAEYSRASLPVSLVATKEGCKCVQSDCRITWYFDN